MFEMYQSKQTSRLGCLLLKKGIIKRLELEQALTHQLTHHLKLGESLIILGLIQPATLRRILFRQRWMRSLIASVMLVSSPFSSVMANEPTRDFKFSSSVNSQSNSKTVDLGNQYRYRPASEFALGIEYKISNNSGIQFGLGNASQNTLFLSGMHKNILVPQISIFTFKNHHKNEANYLKINKANPRFDRYKNTKPIVYNLTLKGYSVFEQSDSKTKVFQLNKVKDLNNRKFELMFSVSKHF